MGIFNRSVRKAIGGGPPTDLGTGFSLADRTRILNISIPDRDRSRHTFVFGTTGVGKTRLAEYLIEQDIRKGYSVAFFGLLNVYPLIARGPHGLMAQILGGLITYLLLAIYCHNQHKEKVSINHVRELRINIRNELAQMMDSHHELQNGEGSSQNGPPSHASP